MSRARETALRHFQAGRWADAEDACLRALSECAQDAALLQLLALAKRQLGQLPEAESLMRQSVELAPYNAEFRTNLAQLLGARGKVPESVCEFEHAIGLDPHFRPARLGLVRLATRVGTHALAERHARVLVEADPRDADGWSALGAALHAAGRRREAHAAFDRAVQLAPRNGTARYQLATTLCEQEHAEESLAQAAEAARSGITHRGLAMTRARALMQLDRYENAERMLVGLVAAAPVDVEAHFLLAQLRYVRGDDDFARSLREIATTSGATLEIRSAYADVVRRGGDAIEAERLVRQLIDEHGERPELMSSLATLLQQRERWHEAFEAARRASAALPDNVTIAENLVSSALSVGEAAAALPTIERFHALAPRDQRWITYRADVARQRGEGIYDEWCDLTRLVQVFDLAPPRGYASIEAFHEVLKPALETRHRQRRHPLDQSLRMGTQTSRGLLTSDEPAIAAFMQAVAEPLAAFQAAAGRDRKHPFLDRNTSAAQLIGCWSVRLLTGGFHVNHIHPEGWISSAYYVSVPNEVADTALRSGWIRFGEPRFRMPGCEARRYVQPRPGRLVLFPSYLWHGTAPIVGDEPRLTIAFDAVPRDEIT